MKLPKEISTIKELFEWTDVLNNGKPIQENRSKGIYAPDNIEIDKECEITKIDEFENKKWNYYRGIPIKYNY